MIKLILAVDRGNAIGWSSGWLPWKLPADMRRFKELTTGGIVVMGLNTFKSLRLVTGLPNRKNYVLTRSQAEVGQVEVLRDLAGVRALDTCNMGMGCDEVGRCFAKSQSQPEICGRRDIWIIGGAQVYDQAIDEKLVDEIYLTLVDADSGADVKPKHDFSAWKLFVLEQQKEGVYWDLEDFEVVEGSPALTFIRLVRR